MSFRLRHIFYALCIMLLLPCCNQLGVKENKQSFEVGEFLILTNWNTYAEDNTSKKKIYLDYTNAINGFIIPSASQTSDGYFHFVFKIKNTSGNTQKFLYKIYYQNETYKFSECIEGSNEYNILSQENFYGSWDRQSGFTETPLIPADNQFHTVECKLRIMGNPRNEARYYRDGKDQPWQRNPRTGDYSFMLVVTTSEIIEKEIIPAYVSDISKTQKKHYKNPYYYFLYGKGNDLPNTYVVCPAERLNVIAQPDLSMGIYINNADFDGKNFQKNSSGKCGSSSFLYENAPLSPFLSHVDSSAAFDNIPVIADVIGEGYTIRDYNWNRAFYKKEELIRTKPMNTPCPCENLFTDYANKTVQIINEGTVYGKWRKQNAGVITRHGFTYGKYTIKIKMTELLNKSGMWNGLTNSIWLITQADEKWNHRRTCDKIGYLPKYWGGKDDERAQYTGYSEIDFEMLKTVPYCPSYQFPPSYLYPKNDKTNSSWWNVPLPSSLKNDSANIMVCCTNWDMACPAPEKYDVGCNPINYGGQTFMSHRWDYWYRALNQRTPAPDDELFGGEYYYFQIEWKPTEIIWRIGPEKNKLRVVGYMNNSVTSIPNNQMLLVISQEFHNTDWWRGSPFLQQFIPFPKKDLTGTIFEITIE